MSHVSSSYFGGPDKPENLLRDQLVKHIHAVPSHGKICWLCYYLNDPVIFEALIDAAKRGVEIDLLIDGRARTTSINQPCIDLFSHADHPSIHLHIANDKPFWEYLGFHWHAHLHSKLYFFSHPTPHVLAGSYNPTAGQNVLNPEHIEAIGDHSISHNVLVNIAQKEMVDRLHDYILCMRRPGYRTFSRYTLSHNRTVTASAWRADFLPRIRRHPIDTLLSKTGRNIHVKCAISHLKGPGILKPLKIAIKKTSKIELLLESSQRRVPEKQLEFLERHRIKYYQPRLIKYCLMHSKFILYQSDQEHCVMFGSFNWSARSRLLNHETVICTHDKEVVTAFEKRWQQMIS